MAPKPKGMAGVRAAARGSPKKKAKAAQKKQKTPVADKEPESTDPLDNYKQKKDLSTFLESDLLQNRHQYEPDSSLLTLSCFRDGAVYIDKACETKVNLIDQANACYWIDDEDINQIGYNCYAPLWMAARQNNLDMVNYLLERNADPRMADAQGLLPLHIAVKLGNKLSIIDLVSGNGTLLNERTHAGYTPIHICVLETPEPQNRDILHLLLKLKGDPLMPNPMLCHDTAIHMAVREPHGTNYLDILDDMLFHCYKRALQVMKSDLVSAGDEEDETDLWLKKNDEMYIMPGIRAPIQREPSPPVYMTPEDYETTKQGNYKKFKSQRTVVSHRLLPDKSSISPKLNNIQRQDTMASTNGNGVLTGIPESEEELVKQQSKNRGLTRGQTGLLTRLQSQKSLNFGGACDDNVSLVAESYQSEMSYFDLQKLGVGDAKDPFGPGSGPVPIDPLLEAKGAIEDLTGLFDGTLARKHSFEADDGPLDLTNAALQDPFAYRSASKSIRETRLSEEAIRLMNPQNGNGDTPLHAAGYVSAVEKLLGYGLRHDIMNDEGKFPYEACRAGQAVRSMLHSLSRGEPAPRRTDLRFDIPSVDNFYRYVGKPDKYKSFSLI